MKKIYLILFISIGLISCAKKSTTSSSTTSTSTTPVPATSTTPAATPAATLCTPNKTLKHFAIYYGYPNSLNSSVNSWNNGLVITDLAHYDSVVFGAGLEEVGHADHANTVAIISGLSSTKSFGYIDIGKTLNKSVATIQASIDKWNLMTGVYGIFLDEFGMDYKATGVTDADYRIRQKTILDYVHSKGLKAIINAWDPDDVFIKQSSNPLTINSGDSYLYESYFLSSATRDTFANYRAKIAKLQAAKLAHTGLEIMAINTTASDSFTQGLFDSMSLAAIADGIDGIGWGEANYSATAPMNAIMPLRTIASQTKLYCFDQAVSVNNVSETLTYRANNVAISIQYNSSGNPSSSITP